MRAAAGCRTGPRDGRARAPARRRAPERTRADGARAARRREHGAADRGTSAPGDADGQDAHQEPLHEARRQRPWIGRRRSDAARLGAVARTSVTLLTALRAFADTLSGGVMQQLGHHRIAIVGSGFSGLGMAIRLKQEGIDDFVVLERAAELGGTWRENTYPGCACDVPSHLYSFSFAPNPDWSRTFSRQPEIWAYLRRTAREQGVDAHIRYRHEV